MNAINTQNSSVKVLVAIGILGLFFIAILFGLAGILIHFNLTYAVPAIFGMISFTVTVILLIRQKRFSVHSLTSLIVGFLFLASSLIEFGFSAFTQNMSIHDQIDFSGIMRPHQVSQGLASIGVGLVLIFVNVSNINIKKSLEENTQIRNHKPLNFLKFGIGIFLFFFGIYMFINGLQPL